MQEILVQLFDVDIDPPESSVEIEVHMGRSCRTPADTVGQVVIEFGPADGRIVVHPVEVEIADPFQVLPWPERIERYSELFLLGAS